MKNDRSGKRRRISTTSTTRQDWYARHIRGSLLLVAAALAIILSSSCQKPRGYSGITEVVITGPSGYEIISVDPEDWVPDGVIAEALFCPNPAIWYVWEPHFAGKFLLRYSGDVTGPVKVTIKANSSTTVRVIEHASAPADSPWDGCDDTGERVADGIYRAFVEVTNGGTVSKTFGDIQITTQSLGGTP